MGTQVIARRELVAGGIAAATLPAALRATVTPVLVPRIEPLKVSASRTTDMTIWAPARPRGVALLSTGHGSWPDRYNMVAQLLGYHGLATVGPMHVDSMRFADRADFTMEASFGERLADLRAASSHAAATWPGVPLIAVGHSFGTLSALCLAGGLAYAGAFRDPAVDAVIGFSSPGRIPGLVQPSAYATVSVPTMVITGTADIVPGFVTDPADHLLAVQTAGGPAFGVVVAYGDHDMVGRADGRFDRLRPAFDLFVDGYALGDAVARRRLAAWKPAVGDRFIARNAG